MTAVPPDAIAVVGMAVRAPGAADVAAFWANTLAGTVSVTRHTDADGALLWARGELPGIADFDPGFFEMSQRDALLLDPQHRLLLECAWEALADAGESGDRARTAVFAGVNYSGYRELLGQSTARVSSLEFDSGVDKDFAATTAAYRLGLQGPCLTVQTACSSSLVAVHLAVQSLLEFDADQALAGGVSVVLPHTPGWRFEPRSIHSADGACRPFDADADGTVMGDGAGIVVLRRLEDALADGCHVHAVLRGSAVNNDGSRKIGYAAPSVAGQAEVVRTAMERAGLFPADIGYVETHGTGTPLGDRVEFQALREVYGDPAASGSRCVLASVKGAIGHLDVAAGVVGLIRATLALREQTLPGTANHRTLPADLGIDGTRFVVSAAAQPWRAGAGPRRAAVSSFGIGGTNAHVILEENHWAPGGRTTAPPMLADSGYRPQPHWPVPRESEPATPATVGYHRATWREWTPDGSPTDRPEPARVVLLADADETGDRLAAHLCAAHGEIVRIDAEAVDPQAFPTDLGTAAAWRGDGRVLLICAWGLAEGEAGRRGYDALTALAALWGAGERPASGLDAVMLTRGAQAVTDAGSGDLVAASVTGLARVLSAEFPTLRARVLDLPSTAEPALVAAVREAGTWQPEPLLVLRGRRWWRREFPTTAAPARTGGGGVSVVLGLGQVGSAAARVAAGAGDTVVLAVRPGAVARAEHVARDLPTSTALVEPCDAADPDSVDALLARIADRFGRIDRVVLAAGVSGDDAYCPSSELPGWRDEEHFRIKVHGVAALAAAARRHDVRRVVLMSSLAGALGALSLGGYSAAAAAMDSAADHFDGDHEDWLSVGWDAWRHDSTAVSAHESRMVQDGLTTAQAETAMADVLFSALTGHVLVVKGDLPARWDRFVQGPLRKAVAARENVLPDADDVPSLVLAAWRECLSDQALGLDDDLFDRGADSLNAIDVLTELGERLSIALPTDLLFEAPTARRLAVRVAEITVAGSRAADRLTVRTGPPSGRPIWCLHPISGSAGGFGPLTELLAEHRVAAVAGTPLAELRVDETIESQAVRYHNALTAAVAGEPPAAIVGWSYGAVLAFEVAQLVVGSTGHRPPVVLLDMPAPPGAGDRSIDDVDDAEIVLAILSHRVRESGQRPDSALAGLPRSADSLPQFVGLLRDRGVIPRGFTADIAADLAAGYRHRMRALERHRPQPYPGPVALLRAGEAEFGDTDLLDGVLTAPADDPGWGWTALAAGGFTTEVLDGHHATLLAPPAVGEVAAAVRRAVHASQEA